MLFREATLNDIDQCSVVRLAVKENKLNNPELIARKDYADFLTEFGKGWVCEIDNRITGFAIVDLVQKNIWALFVHPENENKGIGKRLQCLMLDWYFEQTSETVWLGTSPGTKAELFYRKTGWTETGMHGENEIKFEMTRSNWINIKSN